MSLVYRQNVNVKIKCLRLPQSEDKGLSTADISKIAIFRKSAKQTKYFMSQFDDLNF